VPPIGAVALFALAALALLAVPGPAVIYIVTRSVEQGRRAGLASVLGIHTGSIVHVTAAAAGLSAILVRSATAFTMVKLVGAAYLVTIGLIRLLRPGTDVTVDADAPRSLRRIYAQGVLVNVLNPKTALFFLAFLPQFVDPDRGPIALQVLVLGGLFITLGMCSDSAYALAAGTLADRIRGNRRFARWRDRGSGAVYVTLGVSAALAASPARRTR
jgi:threonine/homoserine/homoserine lactone efflux protein